MALAPRGHSLRPEGGSSGVCAEISPGELGSPERLAGGQQAQQAQQAVIVGKPPSSPSSPSPRTARLLVPAGARNARTHASGGGVKLATAPAPPRSRPEITHIERQGKARQGARPCDAPGRPDSAPLVPARLDSALPDSSRLGLYTLDSRSVVDLFIIYPWPGCSALFRVCEVAIANLGGVEPARGGGARRRRCRRCWAGQRSSGAASTGGSDRIPPRGSACLSSVVVFCLSFRRQKTFYNHEWK